MSFSRKFLNRSLKSLIAVLFSACISSAKNKILQWRSGLTRSGYVDAFVPENQPTLLWKKTGTLYAMLWVPWA